MTSHTLRDLTITKAAIFKPAKVNFAGEEREDFFVAFDTKKTEHHTILQLANIERNGRSGLFWISSRHRPRLTIKKGDHNKYKYLMESIEVALLRNLPFGELIKDVNLDVEVRMINTPRGERGVLEHIYLDAIAVNAIRDAAHS